MECSLWVSIVVVDLLTTPLLNDVVVDVVSGSLFSEELWRSEVTDVICQPICCDSVSTHTVTKNEKF